MNDITLRKYCLDIAKKNATKDADNEEIMAMADKFVEYYYCICKWQNTHNIISDKLNRENLLENICDSVVGGSFLLLKNKVYDAGSGGGFPGVPLAILYPHANFNLIESNRKKCSFLLLVKNTLKLTNMTVNNQRIERLQELPFIVTKAAFSPPNIGLLWEALAQGGQLALWATKKNAESFVAALVEKGARLPERFDYQLQQGQQRCILLFTKK